MATATAGGAGTVMRESLNATGFPQLSIALREIFEKYQQEKESLIQSNDHES